MVNNIISKEEIKMSMLGTLGKVAMGILVAKGVGKIMGGEPSRGSLLDGLGGLLGGSTKSGAGGGLGGLLGSLSSGQHLSQASEQTSNGSGKDFASMFNEAIQGKEPEPSAEQDQQAGILLRAMVSAAKADGEIDTEEQEKILAQLKEAPEEDAEMVRKEVEAPLDLQEVVDNVPSGMEQQVYLISLLAIDLDSKEEVSYLDRLAKGLNISNKLSNQIHDKLGVPALYN
jgi:uncharacterized membrane protein YebE (DUF533 family)